LVKDAQGRHVEFVSAANVDAPEHGDQYWHYGGV
jgi:hypothetical protein